MIIASPKKKTNIRITVCNIEQKSQIKYLGVFIDEHLKWDAQLQHINNKITKNIGILFKLRGRLYDSLIIMSQVCALHQAGNLGQISL